MSITVRDTLLAATTELIQAGVDSARVDAELLLAHVLGIGRGRLLLIDTLTSADAEQFHHAIGRRANREPVQHITGTAPFGSLELSVGLGVFIPRPETELVAQYAATHAQQVTGRAPRFADLCSGSGALAAYLATELPTADVTAVEIDAAALTYLRRNVADLPVTVIAADATSLATAATVGPVDVVVCNPPYVPVEADLPTEVADFDPPRALFGGADGLSVIRALVPVFCALLRDGGVLVMEHDDSHGAAAGEILRVAGFRDVVQHSDLAGRARFVSARMDA